MQHALSEQRPPAVYVLPEKAHLELVEMLEHLRLLSKLLEPGTNASAHDAVLKPHALAWWVKRLRRDVRRVLDATYFSSELQRQEEVLRSLRSK
jgi:hypothetical protein